MKKWAIINLRTMKVRQFDNKDDLLFLIDLLMSKNVPFEAYKYNEQAECYAKQEVCL